MKEISRFALTVFAGIAVILALSSPQSHAIAQLVSASKVDVTAWVKYGPEDKTSLDVSLLLNEASVVPSTTHKKATQASRKLLSYCGMSYVGRFSGSLKTMGIGNFEDFRVSPSVQPAVGRPLWDVMYSDCRKTDSGEYVNDVCTYIDWQVELGDAGEIRRLVAQAESQLRVLQPNTRVSLVPMNSGLWATYVNVATWFRVDPEDYQPQEARVEMKDSQGRQHWAHVSATAIALEYTPRSGAPTVSCGGPGTVFNPREGHSIMMDSPDGCSYRYRHTTINDPHEATTATVGVRWQLQWQASNGQGGKIAQLVTSQDHALRVMEAQALVVR